VNIDAYQVRRATTDDLAQLSQMWAEAQFPVDELEKRFTEFQVAATAEGVVVASVGLQVAGTDGKIHSEWFTDFAMSDSLRPLLWERLQVVAANRGLFRMWTDESAPFWKRGAGFLTAPGELMGRLPADFGASRGAWLVLRLKDESADPDLLEAQFTLFRDAEKARRETLMQRAHTIKMIGTGIAAVLFLLALATLVWYVHKTGGLRLPAN
jgi:N-acetylglutamate synthase-like GNAT family acetyltransferase